MQDASIHPGRGQCPGGQDSRLDWWRDAQFGLFILRGLYAMTAGVWQGEHMPGKRFIVVDSNPAPACHRDREFPLQSPHPVVASTKGIVIAMNCQATSWCRLTDSPSSSVNNPTQLWKNPMASAALA